MAGLLCASIPFVKDPPLLDISFRWDHIGPPTPDNFSGLAVWPTHLESEGIVEVIKFAPEMDRYMFNTGITYQNKSKLEL